MNWQKALGYAMVWSHISLWGGYIFVLLIRSLATSDWPISVVVVLWACTGVAASFLHRSWMIAILFVPCSVPAAVGVSIILAIVSMSWDSA